jgi:hypothetical protein
MKRTGLHVTMRMPCRASRCFSSPHTLQQALMPCLPIHQPEPSFPDSSSLDIARDAPTRQYKALHLCQDRYCLQAGCHNCLDRALTPPPHSKHHHNRLALSTAKQTPSSNKPKTHAMLIAETHKDVPTKAGGDMSMLLHAPSSSLFEGG